MNLFDVIAIALIAIAAIAGFRSGALPQIGGLSGAVLGGLTGLTLLPILSGPISGLDPLWRVIVVLGGLVFAVAIGEAAGGTIGRAVAKALGDGLFGALDDVAGAVVGLAQGVLIVWLIGGLLAVGPFPRFAEATQTSRVLRLIDLGLPAPSEVAGDVAALLDQSGLPDVFVGLEPLPGTPVQTPSSQQAEAIAAAAVASTVKVVSRACDTMLSGSGVVISSGYVVTNAHVVAGASSTRIDLGPATFDATVVLFDPSLDVALLRAPGLPAPALRFAASDPTRGATGATIGYPGGRSRTIEPAAVTRDLEAVGRDIYGRDIVTRKVLELASRIARGDSGGPFILADGSVGGLVFAEARSDPMLGYALAPTSVAVRVAPGIGRSSPVSTGACIR